MSTYNEVRHQIENLTPEEQSRLLEELAALVSQQVILESKSTSQKSPCQDLSKWRGFLPEGVDALDFQLAIRREWDE